MNTAFDYAMTLGFRAFDKRGFYMAMYGSSEGVREMEDYCIMYCSGGPIDNVSAGKVL